MSYIRKQEETAADIVLGLHRIDEPHSWDMVATEEDGLVRRIEMKPATTDLVFGWHFAVWTPVFTRFLQRFLRSKRTEHDIVRMRSTANDPGGDIALGIVLQAALTEGLSASMASIPHRL